MLTVAPKRYPNDMNYFELNGELIVELPNGEWFVVNEGRVRKKPDKYYPGSITPQVYLGLISGQKGFIGYSGGDIYIWATDKVCSSKMPTKFMSERFFYEGKKAIRLSLDLFAVFTGDSWVLEIGKTFNSDRSWEADCFGGVFTGADTDLGIFLGVVGSVGYFYNDGAIQRHEVYPPGRRTLLDGTIGWVIWEHWVARQVEPIRRVAVGSVANGEIYTGVDESGRHCFVNLKTQEMRKS